MTYKIALYSLCIIAGIAVSFIVNVLLYYALIPDPCYYHANDGGVIFNLLYDLPSWNGGHPAPTNFNLGLTTVAGTVIGLVVGKRYTR